MPERRRDDEHRPAGPHGDRRPSQGGPRGSRPGPGPQGGGSGWRLGGSGPAGRRSAPGPGDRANRARPWEGGDRADRPAGGPRPWEREPNRGGPRPWEGSERSGRASGAPRPRPWEREGNRDAERGGPRPWEGASRRPEGAPGPGRPRPGGGRPWEEPRRGGAGSPRPWERGDQERERGPQLRPEHRGGADDRGLHEAPERRARFRPDRQPDTARPAERSFPHPEDAGFARGEHVTRDEQDAVEREPGDAPQRWERQPQRPGPARGAQRGSRPFGRQGGARGGPRPYVPIRPSIVADPSLGLAPDEELVAGRRPVEEAFVARREAKRLYVVPQRRQALEKLVLHATSLRIPVVEVEGGTLTAIAGFDGHQGIALVVPPRRWASPEDVLAVAASRHQPPLVLVLDSLEDPQNVGTLLRTAEASGVHGAVFPTRHQAPLSPAAVKASAGAVEHLALAPVDDLPGTLADLHARGVRIVGADGDAPLTAREADLRGPIAIVVGSEGKGLGPAIRRRCDLMVRIPMHGRIESLNAAVAGSILLYEAAAQRRLPDPGPHPAEQDDDASTDAGVSTGAAVAAATEPATEPAEAAGSQDDAADAAAPASPEPSEAPSLQADDGSASAPAPETPDEGATVPKADAARDETEPALPARRKTTRTRRAAPPADAQPAPPDGDDLLPEGPPTGTPEV